MSPPAGRQVIEGAHLLGDETRAAGSTRRSRGVVTTRQTSAIARPANAGAARAGVGEARRDLDVTVEKDDDEQSALTVALGRSRRLAPTRALSSLGRRGHRAIVTDVGVEQQRMALRDDRRAPPCIRRRTGISAPAPASRYARGAGQQPRAAAVRIPIPTRASAVRFGARRQPQSSTCLRRSPEWTALAASGVQPVSDTGGRAGLLSIRPRAKHSRSVRRTAASTIMA